MQNNNDYEMYKFHFNEAMNAGKEGKDTDVIVSNLKSSALYALKIAKKSTGKTKESYVSNAKKFIAKADELSASKQKASAVGNATSEESKVELNEVSNEDVTLEEALEELNSLIGLEKVKEQVDRFVKSNLGKLKEDKENIESKKSYHMAFAGNPGTGKTTVARIMGKIFKAMGVLRKGHLIEASRSDLVAGYVGQTDSKTQEVLDRAYGGVLFIDEAYTLISGGENDFGKQVIDKLVSDMDNKRDDLVVIFAGYEEDMDKMLDYNQGMRSRIPTMINFEDYSNDELFAIFNRYVKKSGRKITADASNFIKKFILNLDKIENSGVIKNARGIRTLFENKIVEEHQIRIASLDNATSDEICTITMEDIPKEIKDAVLTLDTKKKTPSKESVEEPIAITDELDAIKVPKKVVEEESIDPNEEDEDILNYNFKFNWTSLPNTKFDDIAGLDKAKELVKAKVIIPLKHPKLFEGYGKSNGGGLFLYGPPGTGKTMVAAAIANEVGAKFCTVVPSDLLSQGVGCTEQNIKTLFKEARMFKCAIIYFDEMDALTPKNTKAQLAKQVRSELLTQINGIASYHDQSDNILFLIGSTNKPWDVDPTFLRPGRFGSHVYVGLPNEDARRYIIEHKLAKIEDQGIVTINSDIDIDTLVAKTEGFNGSDISNLLDRVCEISAMNSIETGEKVITNFDIIDALSDVSSTVQGESLKKLAEWRQENDRTIQ